MWNILKKKKEEEKSKEKRNRSLFNCKRLHATRHLVRSTTTRRGGPERQMGNGDSISTFGRKGAEADCT